MKPLWLSVVLAVLVCAHAEVTKGTLELGGYTRSYVQFIPETHGPAPLPLVIALHGRFGTGEGMAELTGFNTLAEREDFIMLYPDGLNGEWNYVQGIPGYPTSPDDTALLDALREKVSREVGVDQRRIYVAGFSNGGFMAERLACSAPERYAAFAAVAAAGFGGMERVCSGREPVRLLFIHGTFDSNIPFNGLSREVAGRSVPILYSVPETLAFWAERGGCGSEVKTAKLPTLQRVPETEVHTFTFAGCSEGRALKLYAVGRGGHNWPGRPGLIPDEVAGTVSTELDASRVIWEFFEGE